METGVKIKSFSVKSYKCFNDAVISCVDDVGKIHQWTILLGNNNTGKTNLLKALANLRPVRFVRPAIGNSQDDIRYVPAIYYNRESLEELSDDAIVTFELADDLLDSEWKYTNQAVSVRSNNVLGELELYGYGVSRYPSSTSLSDTEVDGCASLFSSNKRLINIEEWLMQLDYAAKNDKNVANTRLYKIKELLCGKLFPEILDFTFESSDSLHNYVKFQTKDGWFRYTQLGYGYQSMLSWVIDLCKRMFDNYPLSDNPLHEVAVVLVDEIDLHLHPKWQRDIISFLSAAFPNVQFIVTTHSPLVIQSMSNVNLYVLHREGDHVEIEKSPYSNFSGWTVEEILRDVMRMNNDIYSDNFQTNMQLFDSGLDSNDYAKAKDAYDTLCKILHPQNPFRRQLMIQFEQLKNND